MTSKELVVLYKELTQMRERLTYIRMYHKPHYGLTDAAGSLATVLTDLEREIGRAVTREAA